MFKTRLISEILYLIACEKFLFFIEKNACVEMKLSFKVFEIQRRTSAVYLAFQFESRKAKYSKRVDCFTLF